MSEQTHQRRAWMDQKALEVARRFTADDEPQRRAQLQVAVLEAMQMMRPLRIPCRQRPHLIGQIGAPLCPHDCPCTVEPGCTGCIANTL